MELPLYLKWHLLPHKKGWRVRRYVQNPLGAYANLTIKEETDMELIITSMLNFPAQNTIA